MRHSPLLFRIEALRTAPAVRSAIKCLFHFDDDLFVILSMIYAMHFPISVPGAFNRIYRKGRSDSGKPATFVTHRRDRLPADTSALLRRSATTHRVRRTSRRSHLPRRNGSRIAANFFSRAVRLAVRRDTGSRTRPPACGLQGARNERRRESRGALRRNVRGPRFVYVSSAVAAKASGHRVLARASANVLPPRRLRARHVTLPLRAARQSSGFNREVFVTFR